MIFIFHDNGNGDDDNAVCIVMIIRVPGVTGRLCEETLHWCPPRWLWTFVCPSMSDWLMDCVCLTERHFVFYFVLLLTCICQSDGLIFFFCLLFIIIFPKITPSSWLLFHILAFACPDTVALSLFGKHCPLALLHTSTFFYLPIPLISLSVCAPSFHISPLSFFVSFLLSVVHIKHWNQIDSHVNKAAVGGQGPLPQALKILPIPFTAFRTPQPNIHSHTKTHALSPCPTPTPVLCG